MPLEVDLIEYSMSFKSNDLHIPKFQTHVGIEVSVIGVPLGADTAFSSPTELSGIGIATVKPARSAAPMMGAKRTIVEKYERIEMEP